MNPKQFLDGRVSLYHGDCLEILAQLPENSVDSVVCDPPYHLTSIVKRFGADNAAPAKSGKTGAFARASAGFMGKTWDGGDIAFRIETWEAVLRVLKPGGYVVAFSSSRTFGRMSVAIEDAGFITHPMLGWIFASGFPKATRIADPAWDGWRYGGQALKPALEPIYMGQKPFSEKNGTQNIQRWGTGGVNIDGCRVEFESEDDLAAAAAAAAAAAQRATRDQNSGRTAYGQFNNGASSLEPYLASMTKGRWPANVILDGSPEAIAAFPQSDGQLADISTSAPSPKTSGVYGKMSREGEASANRRYTDAGSTNFAALPGERRGDSGSAARFFYSAKADAEDRLCSKHPTVKPLDLVQWLCRLVTPPKGTVLDVFAGTGTTGEAAWREGFSAILIEREAEYVADIERRMNLAINPTKRAAVAATKNNLEDPQMLPLFSGVPE